MARSQLLTTASAAVEVEEGEVCKVTATFSDYSGDALTTAQMLSLTATLRSGEDLSVINSRNDQDILNANGGTVADVASEAVLTLILDESDNANVCGIMAGVEQHWLDLTWTWNDGAAVRTGKAAYYYDVRVLDAPTMEVSWTG